MSQTVVVKGAARRTTALLLAALIVGVIVGYLIHWAVTPPPAPAAPPEDYVPRSEYERLQRELESLRAQLAAAPKPVEIVITAWTQGPESESVYRQLNLVTAAARLNQIFQVVGVPATVKVEGEFSTASWTDYRKKLYLALEGGTGPCIFLTAHIDAAYLAENDWIIPLDDYVKKYWNWTHYDVISGLWDSVRYKGKIWGIPQDTEARPIYYNKLLLKKLGWTDEQINDLPNKVLRGEFTLYDMLSVAEEAVKKGVVDPGYGIWHRPNAGPDWPILYLAFGGQLQDPTTGKLIADMKVWRKVFEWFYEASMARREVILDKLTALDWNRDIHPTIVAGKVLFWMGGTWHKGQWVSTFGLSEDKFWEMFGFMLYPPGERGGKPVTLSQPMAYFISKTCEYPEVAFLIITLATDSYLNSIHAVKSAHLAILYSQLSDPVYTEDKFLAATGYMVEYAKYQPLHPRWGEYSTAIFEVVRGIETGQFTVDAALDAFRSQLKARLGDEVIIRE
jgi:inositol-phosphate transport system substrate-binding protein